MLTGHQNLVQTVPEFRGILQIMHGNGGQAHNGIHRRADIVAHIGQKFTLCLVSTLRLPQRFLQRLLIAALRFYRFRNIRARHAHTPQAHVDSSNRSLFYLRRIIRVLTRGIGKAIAILILELFLNIVAVQHAQPQLPILGHHMALYCTIHKVLISSAPTNQSAMDFARI